MYYVSIIEYSLRKVITSGYIYNLGKKSQILRTWILTKCGLLCLNWIVDWIIKKELNSHILLHILFNIIQVNNCLKSLPLNELIWLLSVQWKHAVNSTIFDKWIILWIGLAKNIGFILASLKECWICQIRQSV